MICSGRPSFCRNRVTSRSNASFYSKLTKKDVSKLC